MMEDRARLAEQLDAALAAGDDATFRERKGVLKGKLFAEVANQCGKIFREDVLTIVWARRFAGYKRADLISRDLATSCLWWALLRSLLFLVAVVRLKNNLAAPFKVCLL